MGATPTGAATTALGEMVMGLEERLKGMILRGRVGAARTPDNNLVQLDVEVLPGDAPTVERVAEYGFASAPHAGAEAVVVAVQGKAEDLIIIAVDDRRFRVRLKAGEVALYDDLGQVVHLTREGIVIKAPSIELGEGASQGVAREGDTVTLNTELVLWLNAVAAALPTPPPTTIGGPGGPSPTGTVTSSSATVKAVG